MKRNQDKISLWKRKPRKAYDLAELLANSQTEAAVRNGNALLSLLNQRQVAA